MEPNTFLLPIFHDYFIIIIIIKIVNSHLFKYENCHVLNPVPRSAMQPDAKILEYRSRNRTKPKIYNNIIISNK